MITTKTETQFKIRVVNTPGMPPSKIIDKPYTWQEVKDIVRENKLEKFARSLHQTDNYHKFKKQLQMSHTTIFKHLLANELKWYEAKDNGDMEWDDVIRNAVPDNQIVVYPGSYKLFTNRDDLKIVPNHFPYYFEDDVVHLCVWSKLRIEPDQASPIGDISPATREVIEKYVSKTFVKAMGIARENILWFKNWEALQSVKSISHLHVIVKGMTQEQLELVLYQSGEVLNASDMSP